MSNRSVITIAAISFILVSCASVEPFATHDSSDGTSQPPNGVEVGTDDATLAAPAGAPYVPVPVPVPVELSPVPVNSIYDRPPDILEAEPGELADAEREAVLDELNTIRSLHGLEPVTYADGFDREVTDAALIIAANARMTHTPDRSMFGWTRAGANGAQTSNIHISFSTGTQVAPSRSHIRSWLIDDGVPSLGHRRWLLDPYLPHVAYGRVDGSPVVESRWPFVGGSAIKVIFDTDARIDAEAAPDFIAYPYRDYPRAWVDPDWYWSFSVLADPTNRWANRDVDFTDATVSVRDGDLELSVRGIEASNEGFGLPNSLQWLVDGITLGEQYTVTVANVRVGGDARDYSYTVRVVE